MYSSIQIDEMLTQGESSFVEFKTEDVHPQSLAEEIVAFANFKGGVIILGVGDDGDVVGVCKKETADFVINVCRNALRPSLLPEIYWHRIGEKKVLIVEVPQGDVPHCTTKGQYFIRMGATKQIPTHAELLRLFQKKKLLHYDEMGVPGTSAEDLNIPVLEQYLARLSQSPLPAEEEDRIRQLRAMGVVTSLQEDSLLSVAGLLTFGKFPQQKFPSYEIRCGSYRGTDVASEVIQEKNCDGNLTDQIESALAFVRFHLPQDQRMERDIQRSDRWGIPIPAVREAVVNAVCHRDYTIEGSAIRINIYSNCLEIQSPGGLPNTLSIEELPYQQNNRNQAIASFLSGLGYAERRGKGMLQMMKLCKEASVGFDFKLTPDQHGFVVRFQTSQSA